MFEASRKEGDMFHHDWIVSQLAQERQNDALRQAEQSRRAKPVRTAQGTQRHVFYHVLDWTGHRLIRAGEQLQAQHAARHHASLIHTSRG